MRKQLITLGVIAALVFAAGAPAAKQPRPARVQASFDFVASADCGYGPWHGHMEINAYDDEPTPVGGENPEYRESDRISFKITWANGTTTSVPNLIAVRVIGDTAYFPQLSWAGNIWTVHDGGNPGTALSGDYLWDIPGTVDWAWFKGAGSTCSDTYFLTSGNIKITPAS